MDNLLSILPKLPPMPDSGHNTLISVGEAIALLNNIYNDTHEDLQNLLKNSFINGKKDKVEEWAAIIERNTKSNKFRIVNQNTNHLTGKSFPYKNYKKSAGFQTIGNVHTHPYSTSEGKYAVAAHSDGDLIQVGKYLFPSYVTLVIAEERLFGLVITDLAKAERFYKNHQDSHITKTYDAEIRRYKAIKKGKAFFNQALSNAIRAVIGPEIVNGIAFLRTLNSNRPPFICTN